jgi:catechol 2,3-dioxygenase-like lactoylglutathione lyase family enzyme
MLGPIGQVSRTVADVGRAKAFYGDVLGLNHLYTYGDLAFFDCDGVRLFLAAGEPKATESVLYFSVPDIDAAYDALRERGVEFLGAPHLIFRHESGVEEWMAFFNDPDGHATAIMARTNSR